MSDRKENWRQYYPPVIPIYYIEHRHLKELLKINPTSISDDGLEQMLGYFEEFEEYEKAALVRDAQWQRGLFEGEQQIPTKPTNGAKEPDFPPPDDGNEWFPNEDGTQWVRRATKEEIEQYLKDQTKGINDEEDQSTGSNPFQG